MNRYWNTCILIFLTSHLLLAQTKIVTAEQVLLKVQDTYTLSGKYQTNLNYKMFGTYLENEALEDFNGILIKYNDNIYHRVFNTITVYDKNNHTGLKIYNKEKVIEIAEEDISENTNNSALDIRLFMKYFDQKELVDKGNYYLCTLTTGKITPLPYGKVEMYIDKTNFSLTKQVLYFLSKYPYINKKGERREGYPRMEITMSDFTKNVSVEDKKLLNIRTYFIDKDGAKSPTLAYKGFKIIKN